METEARAKRKEGEMWARGDSQAVLRRSTGPISNLWPRGAGDLPRLLQSYWGSLGDVPRDAQVLCGVRYRTWTLGRRAPELL